MIYDIIFPGFYNTYHGDRIEEIMELEDIFYSEAIFNYSESYIYNLNNFINSEFNLGISLKFLEVISPKYYNYSNDRLTVEIEQQDINIIYEYFQEDDAFIEYLENETLTRDGYISYYSFKEAIEDPELMIIYATNYMVDCMEKDIVYI